MEEVNARRHSAVRPSDGTTDIEAALRIARVLGQAAEKLGIPLDIGMDELLRRILADAHRGGLDAGSYRVVWFLAHAPRNESAASIT